jgi:hypothetical protein
MLKTKAQSVVDSHPFSIEFVFIFSNIVVYATLFLLFITERRAM